MILTKEIFNFIYEECKKHNELTINEVTVEDFLYSFLFSTDEKFCVLNDWDEGENNDPFWNKELNMHSAEVFIMEMCKKLKQ